ncbi:MAG: low molecular weight phosphotyrosine protein phosphatase [Gammaproteobacteria bacterium]|nr:low molecular weight phosphotyrosine protein phosphatase [Gammaproteobacteria bacterium]
MTQKPVYVIFVCMGNICRSPLAHGVFEKKVADAGLTHLIHVDSAGTHAYHVGQPPDRRSAAVAEKHGIAITQQRARQVSAADLQQFDYVLAMDDDNLAILRQLAAGHDTSHIHLFLDFATTRQAREVPDPYYGGAHGFDHVYDLVNVAADGLLAAIRQQHHW